MKTMFIKNKEVLFSDVDYDFIVHTKWQLDSGGYIKNSKGLMARMIMKKMIGSAIPSKLQVDHKNRNRLDNRRENLRLATRGQNQANSSRKNKSGFRGVKRNNRGKRWRADIELDGKKILVGCYGTAEEAARGYDEKAIELFGEFATLNFPQTLSSANIAHVGPVENIGTFIKCPSCHCGLRVTLEK